MCDCKARYIGYEVAVCAVLKMCSTEHIQHVAIRNVLYLFGVQGPISIRTFAGAPPVTALRDRTRSNRHGIVSAS